MQRLLRNVLDYYVTTKISLAGRAKKTDSPDQRALLAEIPAQLEHHFANLRKTYSLKIQGSNGNGNIASVPWVAVFRTSVTQNAENGYYVVLLFAADMSCCYLSLNQGITAVENLYTRSFAWRKMREAALEATKHLDRHPESALGPINLGAPSDLGRAYEAAAIESFHYPYDALPSDEVFFEHLDHLMANYDRLVRTFGADLYSLFSVTEEEFQQVVLQKAAASQGRDGEESNSKKGQALALLGTRGRVRSPAVAADAIRAADFSCEIDPSHRTFTSSARGQRYVEAHHLIPISRQPEFESTLDVTANVISLCATCHRMLHFGRLDEKKDVLKLLLNARRPHLLEKSIEVKERQFFSFYTGATGKEE